LEDIVYKKCSPGISVPEAAETVTSEMKELVMTSRGQSDATTRFFDVVTVQRPLFHEVQNIFV
jgi:hypothetical protein